MYENKVQVIREWSVPSKLKELCLFLCLANYYKWFIRGYSILLVPLTNLLKKDKKWEWGSRCQATFDELNDVKSTKPVLWLLNLESPFKVQTNTLDGALSGVLVLDIQLLLKAKTSMVLSSDATHMIKK